MKQATMFTISLVVSVLVLSTMLWQETPPFEECYVVTETCNPWAEDCSDAEYEECSGLLPINNFTVIGMLFLLSAIIYRVIRWAED